MCLVSIDCLSKIQHSAIQHWSHGCAASSAGFRMKKGWVKVCVCNSCPEVHGSGVFRQNSGGQQSGCLGTASSRLKRLETTLTLTHPSLADTGRTSLLIGEQEKNIHSWSKPKAFGGKPHLASIQEETLPREKKDANFNLKLQNEVAENKLDGA